VPKPRADSARTEVSECDWRQKVDLTKYIEEHSFMFDGVFDQHCDNYYVGSANRDLREDRQAIDRLCIPRW
jgi:hypothetical protein